VQTRWKKAGPGAVALVLCVALLARTVRQLASAPEWNWDMVPAMALALEWSGRDPVELHRRTYERVVAELPPEVVRSLTAPGVREIRARDPAAFHEHLPFYRARVLYSLGMALLHRLGAPLSAATFWIPLASYALAAALFLLWALRYVSLGAAAVFACGLAHTPALLNQAGTSSADGLATLLVCVAAYLWLERGAFPAAAGVLTLAIAARPDTVILVGFLAGAAFLGLPRADRPRPVVLGAWVALSAALYLGLSRYAGEYGWWPLIQISFVEKAVHPSQLPTAVDWAQYSAILARQVASLPGEGYVATPAAEVTGSTLALFYAALAGLGVRFLWNRERRTAVFLAALLATYVVRFALFPQLWDRFLAPVYALVPLIGLSALARALAPRDSAAEVAP